MLGFLVLMALLSSGSSHTAPPVTPPRPAQTKLVMTGPTKVFLPEASAPAAAASRANGSSNTGWWVAAVTTSCLLLLLGFCIGRELARDAARPAPATTTLKGK